MKVRLCGVRGSTPAPGADFLRTGGNTSCVAITPTGRDVPTLLLDAGTGIRSVTELLAPAPFQGTIVLSHLHWDHVQGLPFFVAGDRVDSHVRLLIPSDPEEDPDDDAAAVLRRCMSPPHFPIGPEGLHGTWEFDFIEEGTRVVEGLRVTAAAVPHKGGRTYGYRISEGDRSVVYMPDHLPASTGPAHDAALALSEGADLFIHDSQFLRGEHELAAAYGHSTVDQALQLASEARVGVVVLFHHAPGRTDEQLADLHRELDHGAVRRNGLTVHVGREGDEFDLGTFDPES